MTHVVDSVICTLRKVSYTRDTLCPHVWVTGNIHHPMIENCGQAHEGLICEYGDLILGPLSLGLTKK
jgi:hypothetical protein